MDSLVELFDDFVPKSSESFEPSIILLSQYIDDL